MAKQKQINLQVLLTVAGLFFTALSAARACLAPYLTIYLRQLRLSASQVGLIIGIKSLLVACSASCLGRRLTRFKSARVLLLLAVILYVGGTLGMTLIPPVSRTLFEFYCVGYKHDPDSNCGELMQVQLQNNHSESKILTTFPPVSTRKLPNPVTKSSTEVLPETTPTTPSAVIRRSTPSSFDVPLSTESSQEFNDKHKTRVNSDVKESSNSVPLDERHNPEVRWPQHANSGNTNQYESDSKLFRNRHSEDIIPKKRYHDQGRDYNKQRYKGTHSSSYRKNPLPVDGYSDWDDVDPYEVEPSHGEEMDSFNENVLDWLLGRRQEQPHRGYQYGRQRPKRDTDPVQEQTRGGGLGGNTITQNVPETSTQISQKCNIVKDHTTATMGSATFLIALFVICFTEAFAAPVEHMCDNALYHQLDNIDELDKYKRPTLFTTPFYAIMALVAAIIVDSTACFLFNNTSHMVIHFYLSSAFIAIVFLIGFFIPIRVSTPLQGKFIKSVKILFHDGHTTVMSLTLVITILISSCSDNFLFWLVQDKRGLETAMGLSVAVAYITELPMSLVFTPWLVQKLGNVWLLALGSACLGVQNLYYSVLWTPWAVVPIQLLHAFSRAVVRGCALSFVHETSPPGMGKSVQVTVLILEQGLGYSLGSIMWGFLYDALNIQIIFVIAAVGALAWTVVLIVCACRLPKKKRFMYSKLLQSDMEMEMGGHDIESDSEDGTQDWLKDALEDED